MGGFTVDATELAHADAVLQRAEAQARSALAALAASADELFAGRWSTPAGAAFRLGWTDWLTAAHGALAGLAGLGRAVGLAGAGYAGTDGQVQAAVAGTPA